MKAVILTLALAPMILLAGGDPRKEAIEHISEATPSCTKS
jgi:hypothetical protein